MEAVDDAVLAQPLRRLDGLRACASTCTVIAQFLVGLIFVRNRVSPRLTQRYLGHRNIKTTLDTIRTSTMPISDWQEETKQNPAAKLLKPRTGT